MRQEVVALLIGCLGLSLCVLSDAFTCPLNEEGQCEDKRYPFYGDCGKYYRCFTKLDCAWEVFECHVDLHFSPSLRECVHPDRANCSFPTTTEPPMTTFVYTTEDDSTTEFPEFTTEFPEETTEYDDMTTEIPDVTTEEPEFTTKENAETTEEPTTTTTVPTTTTQDPGHQDNGVAFFAARSGDWSRLADDLVFDAVSVNLGSRFTDETTFTANTSGLHFFSLSAGTLANSPALLAIDNIDLNTGNLNRYSEANPGTDVIYRNTIVRLDKDQELTVRASTDVSSSTNGWWTSWGGFSLENIFQDLIAFSVGRDSPYTPNLPAYHRIEMTEVFYDDGGYFDVDQTAFVAPEDGIYYFTFSVGQRNGDAVRVALGVESYSGRSNEMELWCQSGNTDDINIQSRSTLVELKAKNVVWISTLHPTVYSDSADTQTTFSGFKYSPSKATPIAWAVHRNFPWAGSPGVGFDPLEFTVISVDQGGVYDENTDLFSISVSGYYYMEFNIGVLGGTSGRAVSVRLMRNGVPGDETALGDVLASVVHEAVPTGHDSVGRSVIAKLEAGDIIRLVADENTGIFSDTERQTTFIGMLLYEE